MAPEEGDDKRSTDLRDLHILSSNSTGAGSQDGFTSWFKRQNGKPGRGSQDISLRDGVQGQRTIGEETVTAPTEYRVYKRRWLGLVQLTLMNIVVSWDVSPLWSLELQIMSANQASGSRLPQSQAKHPSTTPSPKLLLTGSAPPSSWHSSSSSPSSSSRSIAVCGSRLSWPRS